MNFFTKFSLNPEDSESVLAGIDHILDMASKLTPADLLPESLLKYVHAIDHIGVSADLQILPALLRYQNDRGYSLCSFQSTVAAQEFKNTITIYKLDGGALPIEILVSHDKSYPQHHIAFSVTQERDLEKIMCEFDGSLPPIYERSDA